MDRFVAAVAVLIFRDGRVLAMRRAPHKDAGAGLWETVSGRIETGEQPLVAAAREVREETGLDVRLDETPVDAYVARRGEEPMIVVCYRAEWIAGEVVPSEEHDAHAWWTVEELAEKTTLSRLVDAVRRAASRRAASR
jgi:8-oxo-dGTP pyrophosphatase MutT (NUDIX family)